MKEYYKIAIYGEPAVGKSVFALSWPDPYFICTDGNYGFLANFGAKEENHIQLHSWSEFVTFMKTFDASKHETLVIDLIEDLYQWAMWEFCQKEHIDDLGDLGPYGKGYYKLSNIFLPYIIKLIDNSKNLIILTHEDSVEKPLPRGGTYVEVRPTNLLRSKIWERIAGKLRFCFRAHLEDVADENGKVTRKRLLSISPKPHEFQISRGLNVDGLPDDIPLTYNDFIKLDNSFREENNLTSKNSNNEKNEIKEETPSVTKVDKIKKTNEVKNDTSKKSSENKEVKKEEIKSKEVEKEETKPKETKTDSTKDKINAIRAKLGLPPQN